MKYVPSASGLWQHSQLLPILHPWAAFYCIMGFFLTIILFYTICHLLIRIIWTILELHSNQPLLVFAWRYSTLSNVVILKHRQLYIQKSQYFRNSVSCPGKMEKWKIFLSDHMQKLFQGRIQKMWHGFTELALCVSGLWRGGRLGPAKSTRLGLRLGVVFGEQAECGWGWGSFAGFCRSCQPFPDSPLLVLPTNDVPQADVKASAVPCCFPLIYQFHH